MMGHVMTSFPHTFIGLGPLPDQGCKIVFTKTSVTVYHPDGHPILAGWWDETGPRLWHFPLTADAVQNASDDALSQPPIPSPTPLASPADVVLTPRKHKHVSAASRRKQKRSYNSAVKHRRRSSPRRQVTFTLPAQHVDKDSMVWRCGCPPDEPTAYPLRHPVIHIPARESSSPAPPEPPVQCTTSMVQPRLLP